MLGLRLQIFGQYQGLARNFCDRSQSVSPFWMVYSPGVPGTGAGMLASGGGGFTLRGAFSPGAACGAVSAGWAACGAVSAGWAACAAGCCAFSCAAVESAAAAAPRRAALRHRAIVFVRIASPP